MMMTGSLLSIREAAVVLFGKDDRTSYKRALRLIKKNKVQTVKNGRSILVSAEVLDRAFGTKKEGAVSPSENS